MKRYRKIYSKIKSRSAHTLRVQNGVVLRKSGVAIKKKPKTFVSYQAPPTLKERKERAKGKTNAGKQQQRRQIGRQFENSGSDSGKSDYLPIISVKKPTTVVTQAGPSQPQKTSTEPAATGEQAQLESRSKPSDKTNITVPDTGSDEDTIPALGGETDIPTPREQKMPAPTDKKKRAPRKARLVSYSSKEDSQEDTESRKSGRKRTTVTKMGGVMIDCITTKHDRAEGK